MPKANNVKGVNITPKPCKKLSAIDGIFILFRFNIIANINEINGGDNKNFFITVFKFPLPLPYLIAR